MKFIFVDDYYIMAYLYFAIFHKFILAQVSRYATLKFSYKILNDFQYLITKT